MITPIFFLFLDTLTWTVAQKYNWENNDNQTEILDLTDRCQNKYRHVIFIPIGVGNADALILLVSQASNGPIPYCELSFNIARTVPEQLQIIVIEFPDNANGFDKIKSDCLGFNKIGMLLLYEENSSTPLSICNELQPSKRGHPKFVHVSQSKEVLIAIGAERDFHTMKITATSGRKLGRHNQCNSTYEITCVIGKDTICINRALSCDKNINCGTYDDHDEDYKRCRVTRFLYYWIVILAGIATFTLIFIIVIFLLKLWIAKVTDNFFIFNEDEDNKMIIKPQMKHHRWEKMLTKEGVPKCYCKIFKFKDDSSTVSDTEYETNKN